MLNPTLASNIKDQARHFVLVEAFYKALPQKSRNKQGNESTIGSSCASLECTNEHGRIFKGGRPYGNSATSRTLKKARDYLGSARNLYYGTIAERYLEAKKCQRTRYSQSDMEELDRMANEKMDLRRAFVRKAYTKSYKPIKEAATISERPKNTLNTTKLHSGKGKHDETSHRTRI